MLSSVPYFANAQTQIEEITFAINEDYAQIASDWKEHAQEIIDFVNQSFAKKTHIQYHVAQFKTYPIDYSKSMHEQVAALSYNKDLHYFNQVPQGETPYSSTIVFWVALDTPEAQRLADQFLPNGSAGVEKTADGILSNVFVKQNIKEEFHISASILGKMELNKNSSKDSYGNLAFETSNFALIHELGHTFGLGIPEVFIFVNNLDNSSDKPKLAPYPFNKLYGQDSMGPYMTSIIFNDLHAKLINENPRHQMYKNYLGALPATPIPITVRDSVGVPIKNAEVKVYGSRGMCVYCKNDPSVNDLPSPLLQTVYTDEFGRALIDGPDAEIRYVGTDAVGWATKIVKVSFESKYAGQYVSRYDVLHSKFYKNEDYSIDMVLSDTVSPQPRKEPISREKEILYQNPSTHKKYTVNVRTAYRILQKQANSLPSSFKRKLTDTSSKSLAQRKKYAGRFVQVKGDMKLWYIQPKTFKSYYFDGTRESFDLLYRIVKTK